MQKFYIVLIFLVCGVMYSYAQSAVDFVADQQGTYTLNNGAGTLTVASNAISGKDGTVLEDVKKGPAGYNALYTGPKAKKIRVQLEFRKNQLAKKELALKDARTHVEVAVFVIK